MLDAISITRLGQVDPDLAALVTQMDATLSPQGISFRVTQGLRTWAEQDALYAQGRTTPGVIVTNARGGFSWHCMGCAIDFCPMKQGMPIWDARDPWYSAIIECAESLGLTSGSHWTKPDIPHLQFTGRFPEDAPDDEARQIWEQQGAAAFWQEVNNSAVPQQTPISQV